MTEKGTFYFSVDDAFRRAFVAGERELALLWGGGKVECPLLRFDLQRFAAEDEGRTEEPPPHAERRAREEEGKVARSPEVPAALVLLFAMGALAASGAWVVRGLADFMRGILGNVGAIDVGAESFPAMVTRVAVLVVRLVAPVAIASVIAALAGNLIQFGFMVRRNALTPKLENIKFNVFKALAQRMFSKEAAVNLGKTLFKVIAVTAVTFLVIWLDRERLLSTIEMSAPAAVRTLGLLVLKVAFPVILLLIGLSILDYRFQRYMHKESLKVTRSEFRRLAREEEMDIHVRTRIRERMREMARRRMMQAVPRADVVVTNPTHVAVAVSYESRLESRSVRGGEEAPVVVAKGADFIAEKIKQVAREAGVPIRENPPLARALYDVEIGSPIPPELYVAVANVLAAIFRERMAPAS